MRGKSCLLVALACLLLLGVCPPVQASGATTSHIVTVQWGAASDAYAPPPDQREFPVELQLLRYRTDARTFVEPVGDVVLLPKGTYSYRWDGLATNYDATTPWRYTVRLHIPPGSFDTAVMRCTPGTATM